MKLKISKKDAEQYGRKGVKGFNYKLPEIDSGSSVIYAELTGEHGERVTGDRNRIYYIIEGKGEFAINDQKIKVVTGDLVVIPPNTKYNYHPTTSIIKVLLFMELLDISKLPKK